MVFAFSKITTWRRGSVEYISLHKVSNFIHEVTSLLEYFYYPLL